MTLTEELERDLFSCESRHHFEEISVSAVEEEKMRITIQQEYMQRNHQVPSAIKVAA